MAIHKVITQVRNPFLPSLSQSPRAKSSMPIQDNDGFNDPSLELLWIWGTRMKTNTETTNRSKITRAILLSLDGDMLSLLQGKCTHLSDWHGAENVEEDEGAVRVILTQEVAVRETLDVREGDERKLCHYSAIKSGKESTGSPLETAEELLDTERTSEHLQQATSAGRITFKAKRSLSIDYTKEDKDITLSKPSTGWDSFTNSFTIIKVFPNDLIDQLDKLLVHEILVFCSFLVHFISKSGLADHLPEHSQHFNKRWMTVTLHSYCNKTDPLLQAKQHFLNQSINQRHLFLPWSSCAPQDAQENHQQNPS